MALLVILIRFKMVSFSELFFQETFILLCKFVYEKNPEKYNKKLFENIINHGIYIVTNEDEDDNGILLEMNHEYEGSDYLASFAMDYFVAYCGGVNFGALDLRYNIIKQNLGQIIFLTTVITLFLERKGQVLVTIKYENIAMRKFLNRVITNFEKCNMFKVHKIETMNANTGNTIHMAIIDSGMYADSFCKLNEFEQNSEIRRIASMYFS